GLVVGKNPSREFLFNMLIENDKSLAGTSTEKLVDRSHSDSGEPLEGGVQGSLP
ncbi:hypothetical protein NDU88_007233, partial [Pleurodeles waltl]